MAVIEHNATRESELAAQSQGSSDAFLIAWAARILSAEPTQQGCVVDLGCGRGDMVRHLPASTQDYLGVDIVVYGGFSSKCNTKFLRANLNQYPLPLGAATADAVVAVETIEHLENPRGFLREMVRLVRPGGLVLVTTPNQISWLSKLSLAVRDEFHAFREAPGLYPTHISALLPTDLERMARECGLVEIELGFSGRGRIPASGRLYPAWMGRRWPRACSDNVMLSARKPVMAQTTEPR